MTFFMELLASIGCIIFTLSISQFVREFCREKWPKDLRGCLCMEFMAAFELTAIVYELTIISGLGGITLFSLFVFAIWYWRTQNWVQVQSSPCAYVEAWVDRRIDLLSATLAVLAQLAGGLVAYRYYTRLYWSLGLAEAHTKRLHEGFECTSDIRAVPVYAALVECVIVFICCFIAKQLGRVKYLNGVAGLINAFVGTCVLLIALDISGGYMNPVLASSIQFGCTGSTLLEHFQVYWVADTFGTLLAYYADFGLYWSIRRIARSIRGPGSVSVSEKELLTGKVD